MKKYVMVFDTETISLDKPFMYNLGWVIMNEATGELVEKRDFVIERVWHNLELMHTAYYKEKRPLYIKRMRARQVKMLSLAKVLSELRKDLKTYNIQVAYAFNSNFDERVFDFNCDFYRLNNPLELVEIRDIRKIFLALGIKDYKKWVEDNCLYDNPKFITEKGNLRTTAESVFNWINDTIEFNEEHTALNDSIIESKILHCLNASGLDYSELVKSIKKGCIRLYV